MTTDELIALGDAHNSPAYRPAHIIFDRGEGCRLWDRDGNEFLDFVSGVAVTALGHAHPDLVAAIRAQSARLMHVSNLYFTEPQIRLMARLADASFGDRVFLCNSGTESTEAAMKLARRYQKTVAGAPDRVEIVTMNKSFHGRTLASITATGQPKYHKGFEPLPPGFQYAEFNDIESVRALVGPATAAVMVEPVQGEGGVRPATGEFLGQLRELCDAEGVLLIFDEVQTGVGRCGELFAYQSYGVSPDIMCLAKGLGGGFPIGAMVATDHAFSGFERGSHASTFGGNALACSCALTVLDVIERDDLLANVRARGEQLRSGLDEAGGGRWPVRGRGLLVGVELGELAAPAMAACRERGLLANLAGPTVLRMVPPLVVSEAEVEQAVDVYASAIAELT